MIADGKRIRLIEVPYDSGHRDVRMGAGPLAPARAAGEVPMLLAGNCDTTVGMVAGLTAPDRRVGVVWFDAGLCSAHRHATVRYFG